MPAVRKDKKLFRDVGHFPEHLLWGRVAEHGSNRTVQAYKPAVGGGLENTDRRMFENTSEFLLRGTECFLCQIAGVDQRREEKSGCRCHSEIGLQNKER